jgi:hypothetical protein
MNLDSIPEDVRRFILTSIPSVPHLEAMLLLRGDAGRSWTGRDIAKRLYLSEDAANQLLTDLWAAGMLDVSTEKTPALYRYQPASAELRQAIDRLAAVYARNIVDVANLIHSVTSKQAQRFADAFKLRKD